MTIPDVKIDDLKQQARRLRLAMADRGTPVAHGTALELIARQHGARDWNTLSARARAGDADAAPFAVGDRVAGRYLDQPFAGRILSLAVTPTQGLYKLQIHFEQPVDVVTFESFSAFRRRITAVVNARGVSPRKTSNGLPHLVLSQ